MLRHLTMMKGEKSQVHQEAAEKITLFFQSQLDPPIYQNIWMKS